MTVCYCAKLTVWHRAFIADDLIAGVVLSAASQYSQLYECFANVSRPNDWPARGVF